MTDEVVVETPEAKEVVEAPIVESESSPSDKAEPVGTIKSEPNDASEPVKEEKGSVEQLRDMLAGGDEKLLKQLNRYKTPEAISKAFKEASKKAREGSQPLQLKEGASEEEIAKYREAIGIPESVEDYPGAFREEFEASEADAVVLTDFKAAMHESNVDPKAAAAALDWYQDLAVKQRQDMDSHLVKVAKETEKQLRDEMGGEFDGNMGAIRELMTAQLGQDGFSDMMDMRLMDGSRLQDNPEFVKMMAQVSTDYYGSNAIYDGDIESTSKSVDDRISEIMELRVSDEEAFKQEKNQEELAKLYRQRAKINSRMG